MDVRMNINLGAIEKKLQKAADKAVYITAEQALKDSNKYCPKDQGGLISSSLTFSEPEKGIMRWQTPYARALYYGVVMVDPETGKACFFIDDQPYSRKGVKKVKSNPEKEYKFAYLFHGYNDLKIDIKKQHKRHTQITAIGVFYTFYSFFFPKERLWSFFFFLF